MSQLFLDRLSTWALWSLFVFGLGYVLLRVAGLDERPPSRRQQRRLDAAGGFPPHAPGDPACGLCREISDRESDVIDAELAAILDGGSRG